MKIQQDSADVADMRVADRQNYHAATSRPDNLLVPLVAAVEDYVRRTSGLRRGASVADVVKEFMAANEDDGASKRCLAKRRSDLNRFAEFFRCPFLHLKSEQIDEWLRRLEVAPRTRNGKLKSMRNVFRFAESRSASQD